MSPQLASLIRKELQRQRPQIWFGIGLTLLPYLVGVYAAPHDAAGMVTIIGVGAGGGCFLCIIVAAFLAGYAMAGERPPRSIEFVAALPIARTADWLSRLLVAGGSVAAILAFHGSLYTVIMWTTADQSQIGMQLEEVILLIVSVILSFGLSWCTAARVASPAIAGAAGLASNLMLVILGLQPLGGNGHQYFLIKHYWEVTFPITGLLLGFGGLWLGSHWHLRRAVME